QNLDAASTQRALDCLARFGERLRDFPAAQVRAVGTNTLRKARDPAAFLGEAEALLGHEIDIISGIEEARLIFVGVSRSLPEVDGQHLVVDIGGGSTELAGGTGYQPEKLESLYMGCVSMSQKFFPDGALTRQRFLDARTAARLELRPVAGTFRAADWARVAGASGTIRAAGDVLRELGYSENAITRAGLERLIETMVDQGHTDRLDLPGLSEQRAPVFAGGISILAEVMEQLRLDQLVTTDGALREGILYDLVGRLGDEDARTRTVRAMESRYQVDTEQAARVELTAVSLLDQVAEQWKLTQPNARNLLGWAARLHEIGLDIAHAHYHKHGAYLLENADMPGFNRNEQRVLACLVGAHRRKLTNANISDIAPKGWAERATRLAILLRLAVLFNRSRSYEFPDVLSLRASGNSLTLCLPGDWLENNPLSLADLKHEQAFLLGAGYKLEFIALEEV
ncbi:MAG: Ppx/GppA family phosphatase, partial [Gammaproteobacteria bacterium]|nr:Ppx/GppA family phosphatase [Gammaproteobacteria bacterium]